MPPVHIHHVGASVQSVTALYDLSIRACTSNLWRTPPKRLLRTQATGAGRGFIRPCFIHLFCGALQEPGVRPPGGLPGPDPISVYLSTFRKVEQAELDGGYAEPGGLLSLIRRKPLKWQACFWLTGHLYFLLSAEHSF